MNVAEEIRGVAEEIVHLVLDEQVDKVTRANRVLAVYHRGYQPSLCRNNEGELCVRVVSCGDASEEVVLPLPKDAQLRVAKAAYATAVATPEDETPCVSCVPLEEDKWVLGKIVWRLKTQQPPVTPSIPPSEDVAQTASLLFEINGALEVLEYHFRFLKEELTVMRRQLQMGQKHGSWAGLVASDVLKNLATHLTAIEALAQRAKQKTDQVLGRE